MSFLFQGLQLTDDFENVFFLCRGGRNRFHGRGRHNETGRDRGNNDRHTGKHERFNDNGGDDEPPSKQSKSDTVASAS
jgi:hypothetical protein